MIESATGLILRTHPLTDTSLIVRWLTPGFGRISTVAKGARRPKSPFAGKLDLFYLCDFSFSRSRSADLHTLREVGLRETRASLRHDLAALQQAAYCAELVEQTTETGTPLPAFFKLLTGLLAHLPAHPLKPQTIFAFELKLLNELGLKPALDKSKLNLGTKQIVNRFLEMDWPELSRLKLSDAQTTELRQFLHGFMIYHLGKFPAGRSAALVPRFGLL
jgi:DNA repair protein RecO (recombination protein O)